MPEVTQADREAAAKAAVLVEMRDLIRAGRADHHAEPWAAHREQAERETVARIVAWLREEAAQTRPFDYEIADIWESRADAIEAGEWHPGTVGSAA